MSNEIRIVNTLGMEGIAKQIESADGENAVMAAIRRTAEKMPALAEDIREFHREDRAKIFSAMLSVQSAKAWASALRDRARAARVSSAKNHALAAAEMTMRLHLRGDIGAAMVWSHHAEACMRIGHRIESRGSACTP